MIRKSLPTFETDGMRFSSIEARFSETGTRDEYLFSIDVDISVRNILDLLIIF